MKVKTLLTSIKFRCSILLVGILGSCSSGDDQFPAPVVELDYSAPITLTGLVEDTGEISTRGTGAIEGTSKEFTVSLFRADETYTDAYISGPHAATITSGSTFGTGLYYQSGAMMTKLIGVYPAVDGVVNTWDATSRRVTYPSIDGATDIMTSGLVEGSKSSPMGGITFVHLLTQIKITLVATTEGVGKWGNVTSVAVGGKKQSITIQLPVGTATAGAGASIYSTEGADDLTVTTSTGGTPTATTPTTTEKTFGYAMFAPSTEKEELVLTVATSVVSSLNVKTKSQQFLPGYTYELKLNFTATQITLSAVTITLWGAGAGQSITL